MSEDETHERLKAMRDSGRLDRVTFRHYENNPAEGQRAAQLDSIDQNLRDIKNALFGNKDLGMEGVLPRLKVIEVEIFRHKWMAIGAAAIVSGLVTLVGLFFEWRKP